MRTRIALAILSSALTATVASPQVPAGGEFQVNTDTTGDQQVSSVASGPSGGFVVVWTDAPPSGVGLDVFARRYDASGAPSGAAFRVHSATAGDQFTGAAAVDGGGNFVVAWTSDAQDGSGTGVFARRFDVQGLPEGPEFQVNSYTTGAQAGAAVAFDRARNFVIAWSGEGDGDATGVFAQRYGASGVPLGAQFRVNDDTSRDASAPAVAFDGSGRLIVAWSRHWVGVSARRYDGSGLPLGPEFRVDTPDPMNLTFTRPGVTADASGNFVVAWSRTDYWPPAAPAGARGPGESGVFGQRFDASGAAQGAQFTVQASFLSGHAMSVAANGAGDFVVAWERRYHFDPGIFGKRYEASGALRGAEFRANTNTGFVQREPVVASDSAGNLVVAWTSDGQDGDRFGVFARRFGGVLPAATSVDATATGGSDGNGVLEPGETVDVRPSWRNLNGATQTFDGMGRSFTGPAAGGVSYQLLDGAGAYGAVGNGATAQCSDCYRVAVGYGGTRPSVHWDATFTERLAPDALGQTMPWSLHVGQSFADVPRTSLFYRDVETLLHRGITGGCTPTQYCPASPVTRDQMAAFVLPAREGAGYRPRPCVPPNTFADVPETSLFCDMIEELARRGVVSGCGGGNYCPGTAVTREQMPVFVLRLLDPALDPPACVTSRFADVPAGSPFCRWIEELARRGVVAGCGGGNYCPSAPVTRDQMGAFLTGTYGLTLYGL